MLLSISDYKRRLSSTGGDESGVENLNEAYREAAGWVVERLTGEG